MQFKKQYYLYAIAFYLIAIISYVFYQYTITKNELYSTIDSQLKKSALSLPQILEADFHNSAMNSESISSEADWHNIHRLTRQAELMGTKFIYSLIQKDGKIFFTACSTNDNEIKENKEVHYFDPYDDAPEGVKNAFKTGKTHYDEYTDQWGHFRSVFIPIRMSEEFIYVVSADVDISYVQSRLKEELYKSLLEISYHILILLPIFFLYRYHMHKISTEQEKIIVERTQELVHAKDIAEASAKAKSEFLATMSHEIRTPMNGVLGMLSLMERSKLDASQRHQLSVAKGSATSLLGLINDILDFSKIEAGKLDLEFLPFDLKNELTDFVELIAFRAEEKGLLLTLDTTQISHSAIKADPGRLRQILTNLVGNAIKFTSKGSVQIHARLVTENASTGRLIIDVIDSGIGIPPEKIATLFDPFTQADGSTTRKYGGTGLGLSIVKQLCHLMNGRVYATSVPQEGSTFSIDIEVELVDENSIVSTQEPAQDFDTNSEIEWPIKTRILLVEDNPTNQIVAQGMLDELGLSADIAGNGLEALEALKLSMGILPYTIVLMDCQMPEMDGYEASKAIRNGDAGQVNKKIPIIAMTANAMQGDKELCIASGMDDYLAKPINLNELKSMLIKWLSPVLKEATANNTPEIQLSSAEESTLWDKEGALARLGGKEKFLTLVVNSFLDESPKIMDMLQKALDNGDLPNIQLHSHSLKGSAGNIGALWLQDKAKEIEYGAKEENLETVRSLFPEFKQIYEKTITLLAQ